MRLKSLTVVITLRCSARCEHCVTCSSPSRSEEIDPELAGRAVEEAAARGLSIVLSGGEPMLCPELVCDLAIRARRFNVSVAVYSNGFWATSQDKADRIVIQLVSAGVDTLLLSTDVFHLPYVPVDRVETACWAAIDRGMYCEVAVPSPANDAVTTSLIARVKRLKGVVVKVHGVARTGRAQALDAGVFWHSVPDRPCTVFGQLALIPSGKLYACCAGSINFCDDSPLCAGDYGESDLPSLIGRLEAVPLLTDIQEYGPLRAALREATRNGKFAIRLVESYTDICSACRDVCQSYAASRQRVQSCAFR